MIKSNELRIGSVVWLKSKQAYYQIESGHDIDEIVDAEELSDAEPILLTAEICVSLGFDPLGNTLAKWGSIEISRVINFTDKQDEFWCNKFNDDYLIIRLYYVHQLQNLCYILSGEELDVSQLMS